MIYARADRTVQVWFVGKFISVLFRLVKEKLIADKKWQETYRLGTTGRGAVLSCVHLL